MFHGKSLKFKLAVGYSVITAMMVGMIFFAVAQIHNTQVITDRVATVRAPTARTGVVLLNGVNHSLAALRGWMLLGKEKFKNERADAWIEIYNALDLMTRFSHDWTNPNNLKILEGLKKDFETLHDFQNEIEAIAHGVDNQPASKILFTEAAPKAAILASEITNMIDLEAKESSTAERKALLGMMADVRGTLGLGLGAIRAYLLSGNDKFKDTFTRLWEKNERRFNDLSRNKQLLTTAQLESFNAFSTARAAFSPLPAKMFDIRGGNEWNIANRWLGTKAAPIAFKIKKGLSAMIENQKKLMDNDVKLSAETNDNLVNIMYGMAALGLIFSAIITILLSNAIANPINAIVDSLRTGSSQVRASAYEISDSSQSLAEGATEQAASLEETSASLNQVEEMTDQNAENARSAASLTNAAKEAVDDGTTSMKEMVVAMDSIKVSSVEISKIIKVIEEIAFQTNLLALNAAVEAARAGEHGKGFAVVAEEVRNLAQRSASASRDTAGQIENAVNKTNEGVQIVEKLSSALDSILGSTTESGRMVSQIADSSSEQSMSIKQVSQAVSQMDAVTQNNASVAEESASASEELSAQAVSMDSVVEDLHGLINGATATRNHDVKELSA